ncbi:MAG: indole-3-glycerol phosphate synthase TrpC [Lachnospiraceae bacterium]|nr:indole-3-glycerol phosphate synthase TrpC [Lachnospiraceae bacterium]
MTILDELAEYARVIVEKEKINISAGEIRRLAEGLPAGPSFFEALKKDGMSFICECKKASPSKGLIEPDFDYMRIATDYEAAGADAISVLTEPKWFLGSNDYLKQIAKQVSIPCLRKDFTVDEYMIYEAKTLGASAVLLICSILDASQIKEYLQIAESLGLSALVEAHDAGEIETALDCGAAIIGVNNRNLADFSVDSANSKNLRALVPGDVVFVAESGINDGADVAELKSVGVDAVLVGEALMRAPDKAAKLKELKSML